MTRHSNDQVASSCATKGVPRFHRSVEHPQLHEPSPRVLQLSCLWASPIGAMAQPQSRQHSLAALWTMVTAVLVQSAKVVQDPTKHNSKNLIHTNAQMKQLVPGALERFHGALDALEIEILQAKATLARDLALARAKRAEKEQQAVAEKNRIAEAATIKEPGAGDEVTMMTDDVPTSIHQTVKADDSAKATETGLEQARPAEQPSQPVESKTVPAPTPDKPSQPGNAGPDAKASTDTAATEAPVGDGGNPTKAAPPAQDETPVTAGLSKIDIESMFPDTSGDGTADDLNFGLDFSTDGAGQASLAEDTFGGGDDGLLVGDMGAGDGSGVATGADDMQSLLTDLGDFAGAGTATAADGSVPATANFDASNMLADLAPPESTSFDDLFFNSAELDMGDGTGAAGDGNLTLGEGGEFDDALFGLEGT